jgi:hypothetical protein
MTVIRYNLPGSLAYLVIVGRHRLPVLLLVPRRHEPLGNRLVLGIEVAAEGRVVHPRRRRDRAHPQALEAVRRDGVAAQVSGR